MIPLYDQSKLPGGRSWLTLFLIGLNTALFFISLPNLEAFIFKFGLIPERILRGEDVFTLFSSMFFHASFFHLLGNMWFLWVFGDNLERKLRKVKFLIFYFLAGILASLFYLVLSSQKTIPAIGASGAISGVLGGYLMIFPRHRIVSLVPIFFFLHLMALPVLIFVGIWFLYQLLYIGAPTSVAYWAHIAGFASGIFLIKLFARAEN